MKQILAVLSLFFVICLNLQGLRVCPFVYQIDPGMDEQHSDSHGNKFEREFELFVTNNMDRTIAFEASVFRRFTDKNGKETLEKDDDSFQLFPQQLIIPPHAERTIKVRWIGNDEYKKNPNIEQAFRISLEQFYIKLGKEKKKRERGASVDVKLRVLTSLYVTPHKSQAKILVKNVSINGGKATIKIVNNGTRHQSLGRVETNISLRGKEYALCDLINKGDRDSSIQPGEERTISVEIPANIKTTKAS